jgi:hypothetical protein
MNGSGEFVAVSNEGGKVVGQKAFCPTDFGALRQKIGQTHFCQRVFVP